MANFRRGPIVIVDDNRAALTALGLLLKPFFERVVTLTSPVHLLSTVRAEAPCCVLLDMNFRSTVNNGNEGLYWLSRLREDSPSVPVVLITAYADIELAVQGVKAGAAHFVTKPWDNDRLLATLFEATAEKRVAAEEAEPQPQPAAGSLADMEREAIRNALTASHGNQAQAAERLGITRQTLRNKMKRYGM